MDADRSPADAPIARRDLLTRLGWGGLAALALACAPGTIRFLRPRAAGAGSTLVDVGTVQDHPASTVATRWVVRHGLWVVNRDGKLFALEARCTHLGCTPRWEPGSGVFQCPCHGSRYSPAGEVLNGPAVRGLPRFAISVENDQVLVDPSRRAAIERAVRDPRFYVSV